MRRLLLILLFFGCAGAPLAVRESESLPNVTVAQQAAPVVEYDSIAHIQMDSALVVFFSDQRLRQFGHPKMPDAETLNCLYGLVRADTAIVAFVRPALAMYANASFIMYVSCPSPSSAYFGELRFLGSLHPHMGGVDCGFSQMDAESFYRDERAYLDIVACSEGFRVRSKPVRRS